MGTLDPGPVVIPDTSTRSQNPSSSRKLRPGGSRWPRSCPPTSDWPHVIPSSRHRGTDFSRYDLILTVGDESTAYYNALSTNVGKFSAFGVGREAR